MSKKRLLPLDGPVDVEGLFEKRTPSVEGFRSTIASALVGAQNESLRKNLASLPPKDLEDLLSDARQLAGHLEEICQQHGAGHDE